MIKRFFPILILTSSVLLGSSFIQTNPPISPKKGSFVCIINDKPFIIENMKANFRKITGGEIQLSFSNDRFVKFTFLNPTVNNRIDVSVPGRNHYIRYEDPSTSLVGKPKQGYVLLSKLDELNKVVSGEFELQISVQMSDGNEKLIKVSQGKLYDIPIEFRQ
ncbi:MAG: hypothetical protein MUE33_01855 [Cytophagaceae bacterium]|jgi:hypothetical protein|nr:hypothetical protein [Cytophagaceae bacterium]